MKKDVLINIVGRQTNECGETDTQEFFTTGTLYKKEEAYHIIYRESDITGMDGTMTSLKIDPEIVTMNRIGTNAQKMIFEKSVRHNFQYATQFGTMQLTVNPLKVDVDLTDTGGRINLEYELEVENQKVSSNLLTLTVREA